MPGIGERLTTENVLKAVGIATDEVESWGQGEAADPGPLDYHGDFSEPLPAPPDGCTHLIVHVRLKQAAPAAASNDGNVSEISPEKWQDIEGRWKAILGLEAAMDTCRRSMEGLVLELQSALKRPLAADEKVHALASDVVQWNKAKSRIHYALPKAREFIHRAIWAMGTPERKRLDELFKTHIQHHIPFPDVDKVVEELEYVQKERQVLSGQGQAVLQECRNIAADVQTALRTLLRNAAAKAQEKKRAAGAKGKFF